ncbi:maleylpyruvate isomerase N-terminal domain-containing protein [Actinoplanes sp. LDG1-06]|uniref:Maleylpyruvate isomerase N-terminal domain-containing protein n=1 Tax=Paractinoplanes ovalisporus TaxID=2810368 RepID=A0ABS2AFF7_9ACTN|nr:maleylpyruvate isomerase N-terminal domain-containing protein [Actinoplanes ovalisporus]MBM2618556.1 maleylpyruvate isomerase N-terminal domain-containing protein [Actinoplanes ovalisporus]
MDSLLTALPTALDRLRTVVGSIPSTRKVTRHWDVGDTLAHVASIAAMDVALLAGRPLDPLVPGLDELVAGSTVDQVKDVNVKVLAHLRERDPAVLLGRLTEDLDELLRMARGADPRTVFPWLGGADLPLDGLLAHLLNEINVHGWDIATAAGRPWHLPAADAAAFFDVFFTGLVASGYGKLLDHDGPPHPGKVVVTFRGSAVRPFTLVLERGRVHLTEVVERPDVRLTYDPVTLDLMLFGRVSRVRAALTGKVRVGGRRPWLLPPFLRTVRLPS